MDVSFGSRFQFELNIKGRKTVDAKTKYYNTLVNDLCTHMKSQPGHNSTIEKKIKEGVKFHERRGEGSFHVPDEFDKGIKTEFKDKLNKKYLTDKGDHLIILGENFKIVGSGEKTYALDKRKHRNISAKTAQDKKAPAKKTSLKAKRGAERRAKIEEAKDNNLLAEKNNGVEIKSKLQLMLISNSSLEQNEKYTKMLKKDLIEFIEKTAPNEVDSVEKNFNFHKNKGQGSIKLPDSLNQADRKEFINKLRGKFTNKKGEDILVVENYKKKTYGNKLRIEKTNTEIDRENQQWKKNDYILGDFVCF